MLTSTEEVGIFLDKKTGHTYQVLREHISVKDDDSAQNEASAFEIELYRTECGMTLFYPELDGSIYCAELGEMLYPIE